MHDVETYIGQIGKRCNTRILEKKGSNMRTWAEEVGAQSTNVQYESTYLWRRCLRLWSKANHATPSHPNWPSSAAVRMSFLGFSRAEDRCCWPPKF